MCRAPARMVQCCGGSAAAPPPRAAVHSRTLLFSLACLLAAAAGSTSITPRQIVDNYLFFGASAQAPLAHNCDRWVSFYASNGTSCAPGAPCATGATALAELCVGILKSFVLGPLFSIQQINPIFEAGSESVVTAVAFQWTLTSTLPDGSLNIVPTISTIALDAEGKFSLTQDYFSPQPVGPPPPPPSNDCPAGSQPNGTYCTTLVGSCKGPSGPADFVNRKWRTDAGAAPQDRCESYCDEDTSCVGYAFGAVSPATGFPYCVLHGPGIAQGAVSPWTGDPHATTTINGTNGNTSYVCLAKVDQNGELPRFVHEKSSRALDPD